MTLHILGHLAGPGITNVNQYMRVGPTPAAGSRCDGLEVYHF